MDRLRAAGVGGAVVLLSAILTDGDLANFDHANRTFTFATADGGIVGDPAQVILDTTGFVDGNNAPIGDLTWSLAVSNNQLLLSAHGTGGPSFLSWADSWGLSGNFSDNLDGDRFLDGEEYAFGLNLLTVSHKRIPAGQLTFDPATGNLAVNLTFTGNSTKSDIAYMVRRADDPGFSVYQDVGHWSGGNWTTINPAYFVGASQTGAGPEHEITVGLEFPAGTVPRHFVTTRIEPTSSFTEREVALQRILATLEYDDNLPYKTVTLPVGTNETPVYIHFKPTVRIHRECRCARLRRRAHRDVGQPGRRPPLPAASACFRQPLSGRSAMGGHRSGLPRRLLVVSGHLLHPPRYSRRLEFRQPEPLRFHARRPLRGQPRAGRPAEHDPSRITAPRGSRSSGRSR